MSMRIEDLRGCVIEDYDARCAKIRAANIRNEELIDYYIEFVPQMFCKLKSSRIGVYIPYSVRTSERFNDAMAELSIESYDDSFVRNEYKAKYSLLHVLSVCLNPFSDMCFFDWRCFRIKF